MEITFLGTGTSHGVPKIGCSCRVCTSTDSKNNRYRSSIHIRQDDLSLVIDTGPEFRLQMLRSHITRLDGVFYTHNHADHINGIDDLRVFSETSPLTVYGPSDVIDDLHHRFSYAIGTNPFKGGIPQLNTVIVPQEGVTVGNLRVIPIELIHGCRKVFGYRIGDFAYLSDCKVIPEHSYEKLQGVKTVVIDALRYREHPTHMNVDQAVASSLIIGAETVYLTHMSHELEHETLERELPGHIHPAYDGLKINVPIR
ncbi:MAG: MBL fold metallo-hydrolase [Sphaerochaetaceae bacterium]|nr:MBL fold metallo-hydrolase [Sphaerochaetaceae bacterium]